MRRRGFPTRWTRRPRSASGISCVRLFRARENAEIQKLALALALDRMEQGSYGICLSCDGEISGKRLMAEPTALLCVDCQEKRERNRAAAAR